MGDSGGYVFTDAKLSPFLDQAVGMNPGASNRRLATITAIAAMDAHGWADTAESLRRSVKMGIL